MSTTRLTLKIDEQTIAQLKKNAADENKSLAEFVTDRSIIFEDELIPKIILRTSFISQKSFERGIYRIDVDASNVKYRRYLLVKRYEIWASSQAIQDSLKLKDAPSLPELAKFAFDIVRKKFEENKDENGDRELPDVYGYFVTNKKGAVEAKSREELWNFLDEETPKP